MYAQVTVIRAPLGQMTQMREMIETHYLPVVRQRPGFRAAYLIEQTDDRDKGELVVFWESQQAVENFNRTGLLQTSLSALSAALPGVQIERTGYVVTLAVRGAPTHAPEAVG
jgi:hypothetical protein